MRVSVIIPVFNAVRFLEEGVLSALNQPETAEVLLIEDGSSDNSLAVCEKLSSTHERVKLFSHSDNKNLGASASRNLGIQLSVSEYIAFLDADDIYLPSRFAMTREVFTSHPDADGVHETIGSIYVDELLRTKHLTRTGDQNTGLTRAVLPEKLFSELATGKHGHIHLNGLVVSKKALNAELTFDTALKQCQDSDWILRLASCRKLFAGNPGNPVALRRVHAENRVLNSPEAIRYQRKYLYKCMTQDFYGSKDKYANLYLVARYVSWTWSGRLRRAGILSQPLIILATVVYLISHPVLLYRILFKGSA